MDAGRPTLVLHRSARCRHQRGCHDGVGVAQLAFERFGRRRIGEDPLGDTIVDAQSFVREQQAGAGAQLGVEQPGGLGVSLESPVDNARVHGVPAEQPNQRSTQGKPSY